MYEHNNLEILRHYWIDSLFIPLIIVVFFSSFFQGKILTTFRKIPSACTRSPQPLLVHVDVDASWQWRGPAALSRDELVRRTKATVLVYDHDRRTASRAGVRCFTIIPERCSSSMSKRLVFLLPLPVNTHLISNQV